MTESILEGNRLIAEFDGRKFQPFKGNRSYGKKFDTYKECEQWIGGMLKNDGYKPEIGWELGCGKYHSSWDWLMPVWIKFEKWYIEYTKTHNPPRKFRSMLLDSIGEGDLPMSFQLLTEGIKWYNKNKKQ